MKPLLALLLLCPLAALAQMQDNRDKDLACADSGNNGRPHSCDVREQTIAAAGRLTVDASPNGGVSVKGWNDNSVLVRARVDAWAGDEAAARAIASQVRIDTAAGTVRATGPDTGRREGWSVSYEIFLPHNADLHLSARNGEIQIADVRGRIQLETRNGGVHLARVAGDVQGSTTNGSLHVELAGNTWDGNQLDLETTNGNVTLAVPAAYSAHISTRTRNGRVSSDFPVTVSGNINTRARDFNVGGGGPPIRLTTTNGTVGIHEY